MSPFSFSSCCLPSSSSSSCCFSENRDKPHLHYHITLWAMIKKKGLLCLLDRAGMTNALCFVSLSKHIHVCADHSTPICLVSAVQGELAASVGGQTLSREMASHLSSQFQLCCKIINILLRKSHLQVGLLLLPQVIL